MIGKQIKRLIYFFHYIEIPFLWEPKELILYPKWGARKLCFPGLLIWKKAAKRTYRLNNKNGRN